MKKQDVPIRIKRVYDPSETSGRTRILVDRLWPRGLRKENAALSCWLKEIVPSGGLREWSGYGSACYREFARCCRSELASNKDEVTRLGEVVKQDPVTLLHAARDEGRNYALVLADYLRNLVEGGHGKHPL